MDMKAAKGINISSVILGVQPADAECVRRDLQALDGVEVHAVADLSTWLPQVAATKPADAAARCVLSLAPGTQPLTQWLQQLDGTTPVVCLSGPEGGLSPAEDALARTHGFAPVHLGPRVLRAETAALTALVLALHN